MTLGGCEMLDRYQIVDTQEIAEVTEVEGEQSDQLCLIDTQADDAPQHNCDVIYWLTYWVENNRLPWPERKQAITALDW